MNLRKTSAIEEAEHRKTKTQIPGQLYPENKGKKNIFEGYVDTYSKMIRKPRNVFLNRSQNVLQKYFFHPWFLGSVVPDSRFWFFCKDADLEQKTLLHRVEPFLD